MSLVVPDDQEGGPPPHQALAHGGETLSMVTAGEERTQLTSDLHREVLVEEEERGPVKEGGGEGVGEEGVDGLYRDQCPLGDQPSSPLLSLLLLHGETQVPPQLRWHLLPQEQLTVEEEGKGHVQQADHSRHPD